MGLANNFPQGNEREILTNSRYESSTLSTARRDQWWLKDCYEYVPHVLTYL